MKKLLSILAMSVATTTAHSATFFPRAVSTRLGSPLMHVRQLPVMTSVVTPAFSAKLHTTTPLWKIPEESAQVRVNRLFQDAAKRGDMCAIDDLYTPATPSLETVDKVFRNLLADGNYVLIRKILLHTPARPSDVVARQILGVAMALNDIPLARMVFHIVVPNPGQHDCLGFKALYQAATDGHINIVLAYLNSAISGVEVDLDGANRALHCAAYYGKTEVVSALLNPDLNKKVLPDLDGINLALKLAIRYGNTDVVLALLNPDLNKRVLPDLDGINLALKLASTYGNTDIALALLDPEINKGVQPDIKGVNVALIEAVDLNKINFVDTLIDPKKNRGIFPDQKTLCEALNSSIVKWHFEISESLLGLVSRDGLYNALSTLEKKRRYMEKVSSHGEELCLCLLEKIKTQIHKNYATAFPRLKLSATPCNNSR